MKKATEGDLKFVRDAARSLEMSADREKWLSEVVRHKRQHFSEAQLAYLPGQLVQCTIPHDDPGDIPVWSRSTPWLTVTLRPGYRGSVCVGYPYGTIPRLVLFHIVTDVLHRKNRPELTPEEKRTVHLGENLAAFLRTIGLNPDNGSGKRSDRRRFRQQVERLVLSIISFEQGQDIDGKHRHRWINMPVATTVDLWWELNVPEQSALWESKLVLSEAFYEAITAYPVPLDYKALRALKDSALHLDLYAWSLYRGFHAHRTGKPVQVPWSSFMMQIGCNYKRVRRFRETVIQEFGAVQPFLNGIKVNLLPAGVQLIPSAPAILPKADLPRSL